MHQNFVINVDWKYSNYLLRTIFNPLKCYWFTHFFIKYELCFGCFFGLFIVFEFNIAFNTVNSSNLKRITCKDPRKRCSLAGQDSALTSGHRKATTSYPTELSSFTVEHRLWLLSIIATAVVSLSPLLTHPIHVRKQRAVEKMDKKGRVH